MAPPTIFSNLEESEGSGGPAERERHRSDPQFQNYGVGALLVNRAAARFILRSRRAGSKGCAPTRHGVKPAPWERQSPDWRSAPLITHHSPPITSPIHAPSPSASQICRHQVLIGDFGFRVAKNYTCKPANATFSGNDDDENRSHHAQIVRKRPRPNPSPESDKNFASS